MKKIRIPVLLVLLCLCLSLFALPAAALDDPVVEGSYCVLLETNTDTVLYQKDAETRTYPASLTKIMTVLLAVEAIEEQRIRLDDEVTANPGFDFDMEADGSTEGILEGEVMPMEDLLYCAMLSSANEACNIIAEYVGGSIGAFVEMMNQRALALGCTGTHFANTHGLPNDSHYSTAWDIALIAREAVTHPLFRELCGTKSKIINPTNLSAERQLSNTNSLINPNDHYPGSYLYSGASGIKTGYTIDAGYCLAALANREGVSNIQLLSVVMHAPAYDDDADGNIDRYCNFTDTATLFDWGFDNWSYREVLKSTDIIAEAPVSMGDGTNTVALRPGTPIVRLLPNDEDLSLYQKVPTIYAQAAGEKLEAPISAGEVLGEISIVKDGRTVGTASLVASSDVNLSRSRYMRTEISKTLKLPVVRWTFWILVLLFIGYLVIVIRYRIKRRRYTSKENQARIARAIAQEDEEVRNWYEQETETPRVRRTPPPKKPSATVRRPAADNNAPADEENFLDYFEEYFGKK